MASRHPTPPGTTLLRGHAHSVSSVCRWVRFLSSCKFDAGSMCCRCWYRCVAVVGLIVRSTGAQLLAARRDREPAPAHQGRAVRGDAAVVQRLRGVYRGNGFVTVPRDSPVGVGCVCVCVVPSVVSAFAGRMGMRATVGRDIVSGSAVGTPPVSLLKQLLSSSTHRGGI